MSTEKLLGAHAGDWGKAGLLSGGSDTPDVALLTVSMAYGGLHASGWNHFFSSWQEQLLWRISSVMVIVPGVLACLIIFWDWLEGHWRWNWHWHWHVGIPKFLKDVLKWGGICAVVLVVAAYCACRVYLVVEAFIGLRELPAGVYLTPSWSQLLPHL